MKSRQRISLKIDKKGQAAKFWSKRMQAWREEDESRRIFAELVLRTDGVVVTDDWYTNTNPRPTAP